VKSEIMIIGAGAHGCALAWNLASRGCDVIVIERDRIASGSSGGPGARGVRADGRDLREFPLARRAQELWPELTERLGRPTGFSAIGGLRLIEKEAVGVRGGRVSMTSHAWVQNRAGIETHVLDRDELLELEPGISDRITHALYCPADGVASHEDTTIALAAAATAAGARFLEEVEALDTRNHDGRVTAVRTTAGVIAVEFATIITANTGAAAVVGQDLPTWNVVPQVMFVRPRQPVEIRHLIGHDSRQVSLKSGPDGTIQVSGGWRGIWNAATGRGEVDPDVLRLAGEQAAAVFPGLQDAEIVSADASRSEACSPDGIPCIDVVPGIRNCFVASNWSAHGFALMPAAAESLAEWVISGVRPRELEPFGLGRFPVHVAAMAKIGAASSPRAAEMTGRSAGTSKTTPIDWSRHSEMNRNSTSHGSETHADTVAVATLDTEPEATYPRHPDKEKPWT